MTVARLVEEMPSSEYSEWLAYFKIKADDEEVRRQKAVVDAALTKEAKRKVGRRK